MKWLNLLRGNIMLNEDLIVIIIGCLSAAIAYVMALIMEEYQEGDL